MDFITEFQQKGYFYQATNIEELAKKSSSEMMVAYVGFDCTATSLHVGNLMQIMIMRLFQQCGHKPIILVGGGTTRIGDPTGKDEMRKYLNEESLAKNIAGIKKSLSKFIKFETGEYNPKSTNAVLVDNASWLEEINYIKFLSEFGRFFSVNRMLTMDSVRTRLQREQSLTFLEFNYMILQAYDFLYLSNKYNCSLQIGGSDQWGNIVSGVELVRKVAEKEVFGLTTPLLTTSSGTKMGKSINGAIWLNEDMLSPYDYFQYWRNVEDADVVRFAKLYAEFTDKDLESFESLVALDINQAKKQLAYSITAICHGTENAQKALETSINVFEKGSIDENLPTIEIKYEKLQSGIPIVDLLCTSTLCSSKSEARRLIKARGARLNSVQISDENLVVDTSFIQTEHNESSSAYIKLSSGKKTHILLKITN